MTAFLTTIGEVVTALVGYFGDIFGLVETEVALQVLFGIFICGAAVGLVRRIMGAF